MLGCANYSKCVSHHRNADAIVKGTMGVTQLHASAHAQNRSAILTLSIGMPVGYGGTLGTVRQRAKKKKKKICPKLYESEYRAKPL